MRLLKYMIRRLLMLTLMLIALTLLVFVVMQLFTPEQRATLFVKEPRELRSIPTIIKKYHLDESVFIQYQTWITEVFKGNLGWSQTANKPVLTAILQKLPATIELLMFSIPITILVGIFLGVKSAEHRDKPIDHGTKFFSVVGYSLPTFWFAILLLAVFFVWLGWFPPERIEPVARICIFSPSWIGYTGIYTIDGLLNGQLWITLDALRHLVLPTIVLAAANIAIVVLVARSNMIEILRKRYIAVVTAKDWTPNEVTIKRMRLSTLFPASTLLELLFGSILISIIVVETVFNFDGLGRLAANAAIRLDIPSLLGFTLFSGFFFVILSLVVDIVYACVDPRIR